MLALVASADAGVVVEPSFHIEDRVRVHVLEKSTAQGCMVHLHGNEVTARAAMIDLQKTACTNALVIDDARSGAPWPVERIPVPTSKGECTVNPNRIFTALGRKTRVELDCDGDLVALRELTRFVDDVLAPAVAKCRRGNTLPVVTFHNNSNMTVGDMDAARFDGADKQSHDILFVTHDIDFAHLSSLHRFMVAQQRDPPADDGSLSVALRGERYINVEAQIDATNLANDRAMGSWALRSIGALRCGVSDWPVSKSRDQ